MKNNKKKKKEVNL